MARSTNDFSDQTRHIADQVRSATRSAREAMRGGARDAGTWAREQAGGLQRRVQSEPTSAVMWALGIGMAVGLMVGAILRSDHRA